MTNILLVAGETSGDQHASDLIRHSQSYRPELKFIGIAGKKSQSEGMEILADCQDLNMMGLSAVLGKAWSIVKCYRQISQQLQQKQFACVVLVDFAGFNLRIAKLAKRFAIPVFYYIPPKVWAWKANRIKTIQRYVDHVACIFPFEKQLYETYNINHTIVANPLIQQLQAHQQQLARSVNKDSTSKWTIALIPGSRPNEIKHTLPQLLQAAERLDGLYNIQWLIPLGPDTAKTDIEHLVNQCPCDIKLVDSKQRYVAYQASDIALACSGTVTLELALLNVPMVVFYRMSRLSYYFAKMVIQTPYVSLCNILLKSRVVEELISWRDANAENIARQCQLLIESNTKRHQQQKHFDTIRKLLDPLQYMRVEEAFDQFLTNGATHD